VPERRASLRFVYQPDLHRSFAVERLGKQTVSTMEGLADLEQGVLIKSGDAS